MKLFSLKYKSPEPDLQMADSFRNMMTFGAWKHFEKIMEKIKEDAIKEVDNCPIENLNVAVIAHSKGMREAILKLEKEVNTALHGGIDAVEIR